MPHKQHLRHRMSERYERKTDYDDFQPEDFTEFLLHLISHPLESVLILLTAISLWFISAVLIAAFG